MPSATDIPFKIRLEKKPLPSTHPHCLASIALQTNAPQGTIKTNLSPLRLIQPFENWYAEQPTHRGQHGKLSYTYNDTVLFAYAPLNQKHATEDLRETYKDLVQLLVSARYALLRAWHYLPQLAELADYQVLCDARARAFSQLKSDTYSAATVIGTDSDSGVIYFIAAREAGIGIDNPRQTLPHLYPKHYVEPTPMFARAILKQWSKGNSHLYISGTAAIVGHASLHKDDADAQLNELVRNLNMLLNEATKSEAGYSKIRLNQVQHIKLYVDARVADDIIAIADKHLGFNSRVQIFRGQMCRRDLLVEVEATVILKHGCSSDARTTRS